MKFYDVAKDYIERMEYLEQGINAETGEMTDNSNQLAIWTEELTQDLKDKSTNVIAVVRNQAGEEVQGAKLVENKNLKIG